MPYRSQKPKKTYMQFRRVYSSPSNWTDGLQGALDKADSLSKQGWIIDIDETFTGEQLDAAAKEAQRRGLDAEIIPIAQDGDEVIAGYLAVRQKQNLAEEEAEAGAAPAPSTGSLTADQMEARFIQLFYGGVQPPDENVEDGFIMSDDRTCGLVRRDSTSRNQLVDIGRNALQATPAIVSSEGYYALQQARKQGKTGVILESGGTEATVSIDKFLKGVATIGGSPKVSVDPVTKVTFMGNANGDMFVVAPLFEEGNTDPRGNPANITYADALTAYRKGI